MANNFRVSGFVLGLAIKAPCHTVSLVDVPVLSGVGAIIGGYTVTAFDRVLLTAQTNPIDNGIYSVRTSAWIRDGDADGNRDWVGGTLVPVWTTGVSTIILWRLGGDPDAKTVGVDPLTFTVYYDPGGAGIEVDTLQSVTARGNTTDQGIDITVGGMIIRNGDDLDMIGGGTFFLRAAGDMQFFDVGNVESVRVEINATDLAPAPALSFLASANIEAYQFDESVNIDSGDIHIGSTRRLAFYRYGDSISSYIRGASANNDIEYVAVGADHIFNSTMEITSYRIPALQFTITANSVTVDVNLTSSCVIDIEEASANFAVVLTAPAEGTGFYSEMNIDFLQGSTPFQPIWPASVLWPDAGTAPVLSAANNALDTVHVYTRDNGVTWKGSYLLDYQ